jgi:hypothetical protein
LVRFACLFVLIYGAMIAPWPGWNTFYGDGFRLLCGTFLESTGPNRTVRFRASPPGIPLDTEIVVADLGPKVADGRVKARLLRLDSRGVGWIPTALLFSLILSTPVPWKRRVWSLCLGMAAINAFIVFTAAVYIWNESVAPLGEGATATAWFVRWVGAGFEDTLVVQLGASFVVPSVLWLLVTFNRGDLEAAHRLFGPREKPGTAPESGFDSSMPTSPIPRNSSSAVSGKGPSRSR